MNPLQIELLVNRFRHEGDQQAFLQLYGLYEKRIWLTIIDKHVPETHARDVFQEVCLAFANSLAQVKAPPENLLAMIYAITRNKIADYFRGPEHRASRFDPLQDEDVDLADGADVGTNFEHRDEFRRILRESGLNPNQRHTLVLHYLLGYTQREIALITHVPEETVKSRIYQGKKMIKAYVLARKEA